MHIEHLALMQHPLHQRSTRVISWTCVPANKYVKNFSWPSPTTASIQSSLEKLTLAKPCSAAYSLRLP